MGPTAAGGIHLFLLPVSSALLREAFTVAFFSPQSCSSKSLVPPPWRPSPPKRRSCNGRNRGGTTSQGAMAGTAERMGTAWRRSVIGGVGDSKSWLIPSRLLRPPTPQPKMMRVPIRWNFVLEAAIEILNGTEAVYTRESADGFIQACVRFRVPVDDHRTVFEDVEVTGIRSSEVWEAESSAAFNAFAQLEYGPFRIRILDVSRLRCEEMQQTCYQHLLKAGEVCRSNKLLLSDWEDTVLKLESCYKGFYEEAVDNARHGTNGVYGEILCDAADVIYELNKTSYPKLVKLAVEAEEIKDVERDVRSRADHHFYGRCHNRPEIHLPCLPREMKLCMKRILDEMIRTLGWDRPAFTFSSEGIDLHGCDVAVLGNLFGADAGIKKTVVANGKGLSEDEALENACGNVILLIERELSVCLADMNYLKRSHAELYVSEAKQAQNLAISIGGKILAEWESLVDGLQTCERQCWDVVAKHPEKEPWNGLYNAKCDCAGDLTDLHGACLSDLLLAKDRHASLTTWTDQKMQVQ